LKVKDGPRKNVPGAAARKDRRSAGESFIHVSLWTNQSEDRPNPHAASIQNLVFANQGRLPPRFNSVGCRIWFRVFPKIFLRVFSVSPTTEDYAVLRPVNTQQKKECCPVRKHYDEEVTSWGGGSAEK
jgi:hypothetical protein